MINNWVSTSGASGMVSLGWLDTLIVVIYLANIKRIISIEPSYRIISTDIGVICI